MGCEDRARILETLITNSRDAGATKTDFIDILFEIEFAPAPAFNSIALELLVPGVRFCFFHSKSSLESTPSQQWHWGNRFYSFDISWNLRSFFSVPFGVRLFKSVSESFRVQSILEFLEHILEDINLKITSWGSTFQRLPMVLDSESSKGVQSI